MEIVFLIIGLALGVVISWLFFRNKEAGSAQVEEEKAAHLSNEIEQLKNNLENERNAVLDLTKKLSTEEAINKNQLEKLAEQKEEIKSLHEKLSIEFKNLANDILEEKSKKFTELNKTNIGELLKPLGEKIKDFEKKVEETYDKEAQQRFSLKEEVKRLAELNQQVSKEANNLTKALKGESKTQGNWGEVILESILEKSGLVKGREYFVQTSYTDEQGKRLQPDVIVSYPGDRSIVVDSKVSLTAYEKYMAADDEAEKEKFLKEHLFSIKNHITQLSAKNYQDIYELQTLDFVMMFMPVEPAYFLAIQSDTNIWSFAYERRILLISPTNLIAALKMIESMWRQEYQSRNAQEIAQKSGDMYDKFVGLVDDLITVGNRLKSTTGAYEEAMKKLHSGRGNLVKRADELKSLGLKTKKDIPQSLIDRIEE